MLSIFKHLRKKEWALVLVSIGLLIYAQVWLDLKLPDYMREITTHCSKRPPNPCMRTFGWPAAKCCCARWAAW